MKLFSKITSTVVFVLAVTLVIVWIPIRVFAAAQPFSVTYDFDTCTPVLSESQGTPLDQTKGEVTANFSSSTDPATFSVQSYATTFFQLSQFSGKYLYDNKPSRDMLDIKFNASATSITFTFATFEFHGGSTVEPTNITLTAYVDSTASAPVGSAIARGTWPSGDSYPQGTLTFDSTTPFNLVRIQLPYQGPNAAVDFLVDTVTVTGTLEAIPEIPTALMLSFAMLTVTIVILVTGKKLAKRTGGVGPSKFIV